MTATTEKPTAAADFATEVVTHTPVHDVALPGGAGMLALITLDNGFDHTKPNTFGPQSIAGLTAAVETLRTRAEAGEIVADGPQVVAGYWGKPDETAANLPGGALKSGDVGFMNPEGWVFIVDRKKDMINASGYKVWPREVEDVLAEHPAVRESAVVGVPDEKRGETVKAFVSLNAGATVTEDELIAHCKARMAAYKYPRQVVLIDELPKTVTGKILRRELRG